ncbi:MAG: S9 family peptidase [Bacteroidetes bacterium]|nr:S9 family peptidase [Bacteroidota bacterium]
MKKFLLSAPALLFAVIVYAQTPQTQILQAGDNLIVDGVAPVPLSLVSELNRYTNVRGAGFADWHPVKREMLMSTRFGNTSQLHHLKMPLGARTQITFFDEPVGNATFEPNQGKYFLFSRDAGGNEFAQLYRYDMGDGNITLLTDGKRSQNGGIVWNTKGDRVAYASTKRNGADRDIYMMDPLNPSTEKLIFEAKGGGFGMNDWAPDDNSVIIGEGISVNESRLWLIDLKTGTQKRLSPETKDQAVFGGAVYLPDGKSIYLTTDMDNEFEYLAKMDIATGKIKAITKAIPWEISNYDLSKDGTKMIFSTNEAGLSKVYLLNTLTDTYELMKEISDGLIGGFAFHNNGEDVVFNYSNATSSGDIYVFNLKSRKFERWTESELGGLVASQLNDAKLVKWKSFDGQEISGFYYKAATKFTGKRPVIIMIHGGPEGQSLPNFLGRNNYFLNELGVSIIFPNVRGSTGYGKSFVKLDNGYLRENSVKDIGALLDWIAVQPDLDASRVMTMGGSYGGYMALACAVHFSDRLKCSNDIVGISNFNTFLKNTESYRRDLRRVEYGDEQNPEMYAFLEKISPLTNVTKIKIPMFIVQGGNDPRVPRTEAVQMAEALKKNNIPVWYLEAKDEGHGFRKKTNSDYQFYSTILFVKKYLLNQE